MSAIIIPLEKEEQIKNDVSVIEGYINTLKIDNRQTFDVAGKALTKISQRVKSMKEWRDGLVKPAYEAYKNTQKTIDGLIAPYADLQTKLKMKMNGFVKVENERIQKEHEVRQKEAEQAKSEGKTSVDEVMPVTTKPDHRVESESGNVHTRKRWTFTVVDFSEVPDDFKVINDKAVNDAIKASKNNLSIPGLKIEQVEEVVTRTK